MFITCSISLLTDYMWYCVVIDRIMKRSPCINKENVYALHFSLSISLQWSPDCRVTITGREYMGTHNTSRSGFPCRRWDEVVSDEVFVDGSATDAHNYCRIPISSTSSDYGLYCYVDHPYHSSEPCDVPLCREYICKEFTLSYFCKNQPHILI